MVDITFGQELGLAISDRAIEQMRLHLELDEEQMKIAADEEKKRRRACHNHSFQQRKRRSFAVLMLHI